MQNQVNFNIQTQHNTHAYRSIQTNQINSVNPDFRDFYKSYKKEKTGGIDDISKVSELPPEVRRSDIICLLSYYNARLGEQERLMEERLAELGITDINDVPVANFNTYSISDANEADVIALLNNLREKFGIQINTMGTLGLPALDEANNYDGGDMRMLSISVGMLYKMANDPDIHKTISEKIQRWLDGSSEFLDKAGNAATNMTMSITEYSELYGYGENFNASDNERAIAKEAWEELIDYLLKWLDERNDEYSKKEINECLFEILF